ncbi:MAG: hypothetical protein HYU02_06540 [Thaumarchaeota archaeon]|nr:hypothetical protein [Nitrososphaerota archaeon]
MSAELASKIGLNTSYHRRAPYMPEWSKQNLDEYFDAVRKRDIAKIVGMFIPNATLTDEKDRAFQGAQIQQYYNELPAEGINSTIVSFNGRDSEVYVAYTYSKPRSSDIVRASARFFYDKGKIKSLRLEIF